MVKKNDSTQEIDLPSDAVILATGGYAHDLGDTSLLKEFASNVTGLATTNGSFATGDGVKICRALGVPLVDMDKVGKVP